MLSCEIRRLTFGKLGFREVVKIIDGTLLAPELNIH